MIEGDLTLLLAGVLAHNDFFGSYSFARLLVWGTLGGFASDNLAYGAGRLFSGTVRNFRFYRSASNRIERMTNRFGTLSIFLSKYVYGLRWASCTFYGVARMRYLRVCAAVAGRVVLFGFSSWVESVIFSAAP